MSRETYHTILNQPAFMKLLEDDDITRRVFHMKRCCAPDGPEGLDLGFSRGWLECLSYLARLPELQRQRQKREE